MKKFFMAIAACLVAAVFLFFISEAGAQEKVEIPQDLYNCAVLGKACPKKASSSVVDTATKKKVAELEHKIDETQKNMEKSIDAVKGKAEQAIEVANKKPEDTGCSRLALRLGGSGLSVEAINIQVQNCLDQQKTALDNVAEGLQSSGGWQVSDGVTTYINPPNKHSSGWSTDATLFVAFVGGGAAIGYGYGALAMPGKETPTERLVSGGGRGAAVGAGTGLVLWGLYELGKAIF